MKRQQNERRMESCGSLIREKCRSVCVCASSTMNMKDKCTQLNGRKRILFPIQWHILHVLHYLESSRSIQLNKLKPFEYESNEKQSYSILNEDKVEEHIVENKKEIK